MYFSTICFYFSTYVKGITLKLISLKTIYDVERLFANLHYLPSSKLFNTYFCNQTFSVSEINNVYQYSVRLKDIVKVVSNYFANNRHELICHKMYTFFKKTLECGEPLCSSLITQPLQILVNFKYKFLEIFLDNI